MLYGAFSTTCDRIQGEWGEGGEEEIENGMDFFCFFFSVCYHGIELLHAVAKWKDIKGKLNGRLVE